MPFAARHRDYPSPKLAPLPGLIVRRETDAVVMAALQGRTEQEIARRLDGGHRAYVATLDGVPAAWGWVATRTAEIGELQTTFSIPNGERYLWNFVTVKSHRGLGIYPRLLDAIVRAESRDAERFWIAYAPENHASGSGIMKAGFVAVAELSFDLAGKPAVKSLVAGGGAAASRVLSLPEVPDVTQCWRCARAAEPVEMDCAAGSCCCDYQRPEVVCAA
jgi:ribosomal protein S18 acetylase RimI-like enzyme